MKKLSRGMRKHIRLKKATERKKIASQKVLPDKEIFPRAKLVRGEQWCPNCNATFWQSMGDLVERVMTRQGPIQKVTCRNCKSVYRTI